MYEELAEVILNQLTNEEGIKLTHEQAVKIYSALLGMSRIQKIANSDYGGAELFQN